MMMFTRLDMAVQRMVPNCATFADFMLMCGPGYCPTLRKDRRMIAFGQPLLADAFDARRAMEGRPERAYRC